MAVHHHLVFLFVITILFLVRKGTTRPNESVSAWQWAKAESLAHGETFEGDILVDQEMSTTLNEMDKRTPAVKNRKYHWPGGVVPYIMDSTFNAYPKERTLIKDAMEKIHKVSCVRFVQRNSEPHYIKFTRDSGCWSHIGYLGEAGQPVSIGPGCAFIGTVIHELLHTLGFFHTSSRPDRDSYVVIYNDNVKPGFGKNFWKLSSKQVQTFGSPYEFGSLMHPPRKAWSKNEKKTIEARKGASVVLGNPEKMTEIDIGLLNSLYKCKNFKVCYQWLGMQNGRITDAQLTASSYTRYHNPHQARLHLISSAKGNGAWCAKSTSVGEWIKIDLGSYKYLKGIATQGKVDPFSGSSWVTHYNFKFSYDNSKWYNYATWHSAGFTGNFDDFSVQYNALPIVISARYIQIIPTKWHWSICMRIELYGCDYY